MSKAASRAVLLRSMIMEYVAEFKQPLFLQRRVEEILFKGYHVPMMESLSGLLGYKLLPNDTFGIFYGVNRNILYRLVHGDILFLLLCNCDSHIS